MPGGVVQGGYSYVDGAGKVQHVKYVADPKLGFNIIGASNLPEAQAASAVPNDGRYGYDFAQIRIGHGGVPIDTPEVQAARSKHLAALSQAHQSASYGGGLNRKRRSLPSAPIDTPEVQQARQSHFAALQAAASGHQQSYNTGSIKHVVVPYYGPQHQTAIHGGVPVETPEVAAARQQHINAWGNSFAAAAAAGGGDDGEEGGDQGGRGGQNWGGQGGQGGQNWGGQVAVSGGQNWGGQGGQAEWRGAQGGQAGQGQGVSAGDYYRQAAPQSQGYKGPIHVPVIQKGVPVEPQEVQQARAAHFTAVAKAQAEAGPYNEQEEQRQRHGEETEQWN